MIYAIAASPGLSCPMTGPRPSLRATVDRRLRRLARSSRNSNEGVSRLEDFFESASIESSIFTRESGATVDEPASAVPEESPAVTDRVPESRGLNLPHAKGVAMRTLSSYNKLFLTKMERFSEAYPRLLQRKPSTSDVIFVVALVLYIAFVGAFEERQKRRRASSFEKKQMERRKRRGELQRQRFLQMLGDEGVDSSVFSAVRKKGDKKLEGKSVTDKSDDSMDWMDDLYRDDDDRSDAGAGLEDDGSNMEDSETGMTPEIEKAWKSFVRDSKLQDGEFWSNDDIDEGLEEIEVEFDHDNDGLADDMDVDIDNDVSYDDD
jgi:hypothetical protein